MQEGDRNTKFFHDSVKANRSRNHMGKLKDSEGNMQRSEASKGEVAVKYFKDLTVIQLPDMVL